MLQVPTAPTPLLGSVVCTPAVAAIGDSVCVEVKAPNGQSYDNNESGNISINGVPGSRQYLVWNRAGKKTINVTAGKRGAIEKLKAEVQINAPADGKQPPMLTVRSAPHNPTALILTVQNAPERRTQGTPRPRIEIKPRTPATPAVPAGPIVPRITAMSALTIPARDAASHPILLPTTQPRVAINAGGGATAAVYNWQLGAVALGSTHPTLQHDFAAQLNPNRPHTVFHVQVTVQQPGDAARVIQRSVSVANPYFLARQRGVLQPPVDSSDFSAQFIDGSFRASFVVRNPEASNLTLSSMQLELAYEDGPREFELRPAVASAVVLKAQASTRVDVAIPKAQLPQQAIAFSVHYKGTAPNGLPVRVSAHFDLPQHMSKKLLVNANAQTLLTDLASRQLVANPGLITLDEVARLSSYGMLPAATSSALQVEMGRVPAALASALQPVHALTAMDVHEAPPFPVEDQECNPWNLPDHIPDGMFCMPTQEKRWMQMRPRFMNAKKGDLILNPSNGSLISAVLQTVTPPQRYSHSGIMTRNHDEITHSTASEDRLIEFIGGDGARPDVLKYMWPGVVTQTVEHAVDGEDMIDPETGTKHTIAGFATIESKMDLGGVAPEIVPAMVVKPDPLKETLEIRQTLHGIADFAAQQAGKSHYRFFCYTNPALGLTDKAPASAKWAANTFPTVCSSLLWMSIRQSGVPMEGGMLEQSDLAAGAQIVASTPDGLYVYQSDERIAAGEVLYSKIHEMVLESAGWFGNALTDAADDTANQMLNAFASDWVDNGSKDSDAWRQTGDANAVSPANLCFFDAPLYGYCEPLIYRPARFEEVTIYKWKKVAQTGALHGVVHFEGKPAAGVSVQISQNQFTHTAADGSFTLTGVPVGSVLVTADQQALHGEASVTVAANQTVSVTVDLKQPSHLFRRLTIDGWMATTDYEFAAAAYPHSVGDFYNLAELSPASTTHVVKVFDQVADDAMGRLILTLDLLANDVIQVKATLRCYGEGYADGDNYQEGHLAPFTIGPNKSGTWWMFVDGDNYAEAHFTLSNKVDPV
ncbi:MULTISPECIES: carboxypeptidase-like regulatory domain-containing protein [unclassified Duganella]|uniref:carboxypeptidase-like regulatory domain-containing protein n=1 Tax=unclassified Duganella TaxID=2636909 RepID=UPI000E34894D|nr:MULTISPECIES: carboxypeptidase-like regulatory domain-containing protein [unclassified Duganella]RFP12022.1 carboxypeptidase regulatory-like domain-containing protein [Duganella sp. BJB475]RFP29967.1 carboxypeptidase regulatory-like domain-containing protein [Duganella sp. BJB476]